MHQASDPPQFYDDDFEEIAKDFLFRYYNITQNPQISIVTWSLSNYPYYISWSVKFKIAGMAYTCS